MNILQGGKKCPPIPHPLFYLGAHLLIDLLQAQHFLCIPVYNNEVLYDHVNWISNNALFRPDTTFVAKYFLDVSYIVYMVAVFSRDGLEKPCREILRQEQIQLIVPQRRPFRNSLLEL